MEDEYTQCLNCGQEIEEMVCEECRQKEIASWLQDNNVSWQIQALFFRRLEEQIPGKAYEGYCIICGNEKPVLCEMCFFQKSTIVFNEIVRNKMWLESFKNIFKPQHV